MFMISIRGIRHVGPYNYGWASICRYSKSFLGEGVRGVIYLAPQLFGRGGDRHHRPHGVGVYGPKINLQ